MDIVAQPPGSEFFWVLGSMIAVALVCSQVEWLWWSLQKKSQAPPRSWHGAEAEWTATNWAAGRPPEGDSDE